MLYASMFDGDPVKIVNVCGRFDLVSGINERFGEDVHIRLQREHAILLRHPNGGSDWTLTEEVPGLSIATLISQPACVDLCTTSAGWYPEDDLSLHLSWIANEIEII